MADPIESLTGHRWKSRVVVVLAADARDPRLAEQRRLFAEMGAGAAERDLLLIEVFGPEAHAVRRRFGAKRADFALLVGKDGGVKLRAPGPVGKDQLFALIDGMPMRREEMRRR